MVGFTLPVRLSFMRVKVRPIPTSGPSMSLANEESFADRSETLITFAGFFIKLLRRRQRSGQSPLIQSDMTVRGDALYHGVEHIIRAHPRRVRSARVKHHRED